MKKGCGKSTYLISVVEKPAKNINLNMASKVVVQKTAQLRKNCASSGCAFSNSLSGPEVTPPLVSVGSIVKCELLKRDNCFLVFSLTMHNKSSWSRIPIHGCCLFIFRVITCWFDMNDKANCYCIVTVSILFNVLSSLSRLRFVTDVFAFNASFNNPTPSPMKLSVCLRKDA